MDMKQNILYMALILCQRNGKTTNLEIKNGLHQVFQNDATFLLNQKEVSDIMAELHKDGFFDRDNQDSSMYYTYCISPAAAAATVAAAADIIEIDYDLLKKGTMVMPLPDPYKNSDSAALPDTIGGGAPLYINSNQDIKSNQLDPTNGSHVCYISGNPTKFKQGPDDRKTLRKATFTEYNPTTPGLSYDNLNYCTVRYYNKNVVV